MPCPDGLYFNEGEGVCDWPENVLEVSIKKYKANLVWCTFYNFALGTLRKCMLYHLQSNLLIEPLFLRDAESLWALLKGLSVPKLILSAPSSVKRMACSWTEVTVTSITGVWGSSSSTWIAL